MVERIINAIVMLLEMFAQRRQNRRDQPPIRTIDPDD
jgi:hypothetical protein